MRCSDVLGRLSENARKELERNVFRVLGRKLPLESALVQEDSLRFIFGTLSAVEKKTLKLIVTHFGYTPFPQENLEEAAGWQMSGAEIHFGLMMLRQKGLIFSLRKTWGERLFVLPEETFPFWQDLLLPPLPFFRPIGDEEVLVLHERDGDVVQDLFFLLSYAARHSIPLTKKRMIPRPVAQHLVRLTGLKKDHVAGLGLVLPTENQGDLPLYLLADIALKLGLLRPQTDRFVIGDALFSWLHTHPDQMHRDIFRIWKKLFFPKDPWLQHFLAKFEKMPDQVWFPLDGLMEWLEHLERRAEKGLTEKEKGQRLIQEWLLPFCGLGWVEIGEGSTGRVVFRKKIPFAFDSDRHGFTEPLPLYVQPDLDIIVPPGTPLSVLWELETVAQRQDDGSIWRYRICRDSVKRALEAGRTEEDILSFLRKYAKGKVPEQVEFTIRDWALEFSSFMFAEALLLCTRNQKDADEISLDGRLSPWIVWRVGPTCFVVRREGEKEIRKVLAEKGFHPLFTSRFSRHAIAEKPDVGDDDGKVPPKAPEGEGAGIFRPPFDPGVFSPDPHPPRPEDWRSSLSRLPSAWIRDFRPYHSSTKKELLKTAISWKTYVKLRMGGNDQRILPLSLKEEEGRWKLIGIKGGERICLLPEQWEEMQLILPGIHDYDEVECDIMK